MEKIRSLMHRYTIPAAFIVFVLIDLLMFGLAQLLLLLPETLPINYFTELIMMLVPVALVFFFGFSHSFKNGNILRGLFCVWPFVVTQLIALVVFFSKNLGNPEAAWKPWYLIVYGISCVVGVGVREECIYRAIIQNILAKRYANSVKGVWITVIISAIIFGLTHASNLLFGMDPLAVLTQMISAAFIGLLFGAVYLRSGSIWAVILIHTLTDIVGLAESTFLHLDDIEVMNKLTWATGKPILWAIYIGFTVFLLRPSKCRQIFEGFCFAGKEM